MLWISVIFNLVLLEVLTVIASNKTHIDCRDGWVTYSDACYRVIDMALTWQEASAMCVSHTARLLTVESDVELQWIASHFGKSLYPFWLGLKGLDNNSFKWSQKTIPTTYDIPLDNEPNNADGERNCVSIKKNMFFRNRNCSRLIDFICKASKPTPASTCETKKYYGYLKSLVNCYWYVEYNRKNWNDAEAYCKSIELKSPDMTADLLSIEDYSELSNLRSYMNTFTGVEFWTGLKYNTERKLYEYSDGTSYSKEVAPWLTKKVMAYSGGDCGVLQNNNKVIVSDCNRRYPFMCKHSRLRELERDCPAFWLRAGDSCYFTSEERDVNWTTAQSKCKSMGGHLLKTDSPDEKTWLENTAALQFPDYWTGLNALAQSGVYVWEDKTKLVNSLISWNDQGIRRGHCAKLDIDKAKSMVHLCEVYTGLLACEYKLKRQKGQKSCLDGWFLNGNKCYYFEKKDVDSWYDVRKLCYRTLIGKNTEVEIDMHYITIENVYQLNFVVEKIKSLKLSEYYSMPWLGLNRLGDYKTWVWEDAPGLPENTIPMNYWGKEPNLEKKCVAITKHGQYSTLECEQTNNYICEMEKTWTGSYGGSAQIICPKLSQLLACLMLLLLWFNLLDKGYAVVT